MNNILSYFIKDKLKSEVKYYKQINVDYQIIRINNGDLILYSYNKCHKWGQNYITNVSMMRGRLFSNSRIEKQYNSYYLFYKENNVLLSIKERNEFIYIGYKNLKPYKKKIIYKLYFNNGRYYIYKIKYYNKYLYKIIKKNIEHSIPYRCNIILIPNKYEMQYFSKLFLIL